MINWKSHRAALKGGSSYLVKGVLSVVHSVTSSAVIDTPDCYTAVDSLVEPFNAVTGLIDAAPIVTAGLISEFTARDSLIDASDIVLSSIISENGINTDSAIQPVFALDGELCDCG